MARRKWSLRVVNPDQKKAEEEARREDAWNRHEDNRRGAFEFNFIRGLTRADAPRCRFPHDPFQD